MALLQPPPTFVLPIVVDEETRRVSFSPIWLRWFLDFAQVINDAGGTNLSINIGAASPVLSLGGSADGDSIDSGGMIIPGPQGIPGIQGFIGSPGMDGEPGEDGLQGVPGADGAAGASGATGATGPVGPAVFLVGEEGEPGADSMLPGAQGPVGATGSVGPQGSAIYLSAEAGEDGEPGIPGALGLTGAQGPTGPAVFLDAEQGEQGLDGIPGGQGPIGATGSVGPQGPAIYLSAEPGDDGESSPAQSLDSANFTGVNWTDLTDGGTTTLHTHTSGVASSITVANEATDTSCFLLFATAATGDLGPKSNANLTLDSATGIVTFASTVLTTTDINGGTIDGATIGGASAAAGSFTTLSTTGTVTLSGTGSNLATGSNFISNGGTDAGLSFDASNKATFSNNLQVNGVGSHGIGGAASAAIRLRVLGDFTGTNDTRGMAIEGALTGNDTFGLSGLIVNPTMNKPASGTVGFAAILDVRGGALGAGAGAITNASTVYISAGMTGASNNYALWVDAGTVRIDGTTGAGASLGTLTNAPSAGDPAYWLPINANGTTYYIPCWT